MRLESFAQFTKRRRDTAEITTTRGNALVVRAEIGIHGF